MGGMGAGPVPSAAPLGIRLARGEAVEDSELIAALRRVDCRGEVVEFVITSRRLIDNRLALPLLLRHPACPVPFGLDALPRLGWRDLARVATEPRVRLAIRYAGERRLLQCQATLTAGERIALARIAPRAVLQALTEDPDDRVITAAIENPRCTEMETAQIVGCNRHCACISAVLRHPVWGTRPTVRNAAVQSPRIPVPMVLGLAATMTSYELQAILASGAVRDEVRLHLAALLDGRNRGAHTTRRRRPLDLPARPG